MAETAVQTPSTPAPLAQSVVLAAAGAAITTAETEVKAEASKLKAAAVTESKTKPWVFAAIAVAAGVILAHFLHVF